MRLPGRWRGGWVPVGLTSGSEWWRWGEWEVHAATRGTWAGAGHGWGRDATRGTTWDVKSADRQRGKWRGAAGALRRARVAGRFN